MLRPFQIWLTFAACLAIVLAAVGWLSFKALESDAAEATARSQAAQEENVRLALWRMDSQIAPLIAQESARPYFVYTPFYSAERAFGRMFNLGKGDADLNVPSPLLTQPDPLVLIHFQFEPEKTLTSPEVPTGKFLSMAVPQYLTESEYTEDKTRLTDLQGRLEESELLAALPPLEPQTIATSSPPNPSANLIAANTAESENPFADSQSANAPPAQQQQTQRSQVEYQARQRSLVQSNIAAQKNSEYADVSKSSGNASSDVQMSIMAPLWIGDDLLLARRVKAGGRQYLQGCVLNWSAIQTQLLAAIADLLPQAALVPNSQPNGSASMRQLASLPVQLLPGAVSVTSAECLSPIKLSLLVAWGALLLAALAAAILLKGVLALSERRATFVSAVTHELRTPLTTFRMYSEMLSEGMVTDEAQRRSYFNTLRTEADRLTHLVANVLAYARLERGRPSGRIEAIPLGKLLDVATQRLAQRACEAKLDLSIETDDAVQQHSVLADPAAVEQILFNLVDNACKYAATATDRTLSLSAVAENGRAEIRLRDHGPGILASGQRRLFQPFHKSASEAAHSMPGVGLGLALSRRLARDMGGDLRFEPTASGACFVLSLPAAG